MKLVVNEIDKIKPIYQTSEFQLQLDIYIKENDMYEFMCEICEYIGDKKFKEWTKKILS